MASLFDVVNRRRRSKELADKFREGATPDELEYFDRFYQEPSSSPVMARGALEGELDAADALQRQLMARGMNNLQAQDATRRALAQEEAELDRTAQSIATQYGPGGLKGTGEGSFESYQQGLKPDPSSVGWGIHPDDQDRGLSLDDWSRQRAMARQDASGVSAESKARYDEQTVDDRISMIEEQAKSLPAELQAKGASAEVTTAYMQELGRQIQITRENAPDTSAYQNAVTAVENLHKLYKGTSGGGGFSSYGAQGFINETLKEGITQSQASGDTVVEQDGQQLIVPRQTHVEGEYPK